MPARLSGPGLFAGGPANDPKDVRTLTDARAWRAETHAALRRGTLKAPTRITLTEAADEWLKGAQGGVVRTRSGETYKPSALRAYEQALRTKVVPQLGHLRLSSVTRAAVQDLVDRLVASGLSASTVRNAILPLRAIYRRAISRSEVLVNPTLGLALPAVRGTRDRVAEPAEAHSLLEALPSDDQAVWATALYAGLRRGELRALRWRDVDFEAGLLRVERSWDDKVGAIEPKSRAGRRRVPLARPLRVHLAAHRLRSPGADAELVFGRGEEKALDTTALTRRARRAWERAGLRAIGLHEWLWEGSTENATLARTLLADLVDRGLDPTQAILFVIDGGKALRRAIRDVFGEHALVHRCHRHKERNVTDLLPERDREVVRGRMRAAWSLTDPELARQRLELLEGELDRSWPDAAASLREGMDETLTLMRLGISGQLAKTLSSTNPCESMIEIVRSTHRNVKRWREGEMRRRWTAAGMLVAEQQFRRIIGYRDLATLVVTIERHSILVAQ